MPIICFNQPIKAIVSYFDLDADYASEVVDEEDCSFKEGDKLQVEYG